MPDTNITLDLLRWAEATPDAPALASESGRLTYRELDTLVWKCAQHLHDHGVRRGDIVATTFEAGPDHAVALLALARIGATELGIPRSAGALERRTLAAEARAHWLASDRPEGYETGLPAIPVSLRRIAQSPSHTTATMDEVPRAPWQIVRGSGTTGVPKWMTISHAQARSRFLTEFPGYPVTQADCLAGLSSLEFAGIKHSLGRAIAAGACHIACNGPATNVLGLIAARGVTLLTGSVFHAEQILRVGGPEVIGALRNLRLLALTSSTVSDGLRARLRERIGDRLMVLYGTNEAWLLTASGPPEVFEQAGTVGRALPGVELEIVDADGRNVPCGETGLVRARRPGLIDGYAGDQENTRQHFRDGWFYPGDLGALTADGQLIHRGRADGMMIVNGINLYPGEIESVLLSHPAVREAAVVALRTPSSQDVPFAAVTQAPEAAVPDQQLLAYAAERLGGRRPAAVITMEAIPRTELGKVMRPELRSRILAHLDRSARSA